MFDTGAPKTVPEACGQARAASRIRPAAPSCHDRIACFACCCVPKSTHGEWQCAHSMISMGPTTSAFRWSRKCRRQGGCCGKTNCRRRCRFEPAMIAGALPQLQPGLTLSFAEAGIDRHALQARLAHIAEVGFAPAERQPVAALCFEGCVGPGWRRLADQLRARGAKSLHGAPSMHGRHDVVVEIPRAPFGGSGSVLALAREALAGNPATPGSPLERILRQ